MIEDDRFIGEMYVRSLEQAKYQVEWAIDGRDGLVMATNKPYDLILLDVMLPEMRGSEILKRVRDSQDKTKPAPRVIVMTNFDQDEESRMAMEHEADAYLIKAEITPRRLIEVINQLDTPQNS